MQRLPHQPASPEESVARVAELWAELLGQAILFNEGVARSLGMSAVDLQAFGIISRHGGPMTPTELAARAVLPASTTTRVLDRLEAAGYVVRSGVSTDRRKVAVEVVESKAADVAQRYAGKIDQIRQLHAHRTDAEVAMVISYLAELTAIDSSRHAK